MTYLLPAWLRFFRVLTWASSGCAGGESHSSNWVVQVAKAKSRVVQVDKAKSRVVYVAKSKARVVQVAKAKARVVRVATAEAQVCRGLKLKLKCVGGSS